MYRAALAALLLLTGLCAPLRAAAETIWTGPMIEFTKTSFADVSDPANRDLIIEGVVELTRGDSQGLFNYAVREDYDRFGGTSPGDTEWAFETNNEGLDVSATNFAALTFEPWIDAIPSQIEGGTPAMVGQDAVLHIISQDIYIDLMFTRWDQGRGDGAILGGAFSYMRSTDAPEPAAAALLIGVLGTLVARRARIGR
jgi:hypothetical protein